MRYLITLCYTLTSLLLVVNLAKSNETFQEEDQTQISLMKKRKISEVSTPTSPAKKKIVSQASMKKYLSSNSLKETSFTTLEKSDVTEEEKNIDLKDIKRPILTGVDFSDEGPVLIIDDFNSFPPTRYFVNVWDKKFDFEIDMRKKYCIGRYDTDTFISSSCPENKAVEGKYEHCYKCNQSLQFNPAFYNASKDKISEKQKKI